MVDPFDGPEIATLAVAVLSLIGVLVNTFVSNRSRQHSQVVRAQVENEHAESENPNLRDNIDANERARIEDNRKLNSKVDRVITDVHALKEDVAGVKDDLADVKEHGELLEDGWASNRKRILNLEDTESKRREVEDWGPPQETRRSRRARP